MKPIPLFMSMGDKKHSFVKINKKRRTDQSQFVKKNPKNTHTKSSLSLISVNHSSKGALKLN